MRSLAIAAGLAVLAVFAAGCNHTDAVASSTSKMTLTANPSSIDLSTNPDGRSTIVAYVFDSTGAPQIDIAVRLSTDHGTLASGGAALYTDKNGMAVDTLNTTQTSIVTAASGSQSATVTVTVTSSAKAAAR